MPRFGFGFGIFRRGAAAVGFNPGAPLSGLVPGTSTAALVLDMYDNWPMTTTGTDAYAFPEARDGDTASAVWENSDLGDEEMDEPNFDATGSWSDNSTGTGSATISGGQLTLDGSDASNRGIMGQSFAPGAGGYYLLEVAVESVSGSSPSLNFNFETNYTPGGTDSLITITDDSFDGQTYKAILHADADTAVFYAYTNNDTTAVINSMSLKEIQSGFMGQLTAANEVLVNEGDGRGKVNRMLQSYDLSGSSSSSGSAYHTGWYDDADGIPNARAIIDNPVGSGDTSHWIQLSTDGADCINGQPIRFSAKFKKGTVDHVNLKLFGTAAPATTDIWFDLTNGVTGTVDAGGTAAITSLGSDWYLCEASVVADADDNIDLRMVPLVVNMVTGPSDLTPDSEAKRSAVAVEDGGLLVLKVVSRAIRVKPDVVCGVDCAYAAEPVVSLLVIARGCPNFCLWKGILKVLEARRITVLCKDAISV